MNLFRSEEHVRSWSLYNPDSEDGIMPVETCARAFSVDYVTTRLEPDWFLKAPQLRAELLQSLKKVGKAGPFWGNAT